MQFHLRNLRRPKKLGILAGTFNPPTTAHLQLVDAALGRHVDEVLCVLPRAFPHKQYFGATLEQRLEMLALAVDSGLGYSIASSEAGLFVDIARECREYYGNGVELKFICGRDAAERVLNWDYGREDAVEHMLQNFELLVAARQGEFQSPAPYGPRIHRLHMRPGYDAVSSTDIRERIARGESWEHLVPKEIIERVRAIYS